MGRFGGPDNRTRPAEVAEEVYWKTVRHLGEVSPDFIPPKRVRGFLSRFKDRGIFAIDSTVIKLASAAHQRLVAKASSVW